MNEDSKRAAEGIASMRNEDELQPGIPRRMGNFLADRGVTLEEFADTTGIDPDMFYYDGTLKGDACAEVRAYWYCDHFERIERELLEFGSVKGSECGKCVLATVAVLALACVVAAVMGVM